MCVHILSCVAYGSWQRERNWVEKTWGMCNNRFTRSPPLRHASNIKHSVDRDAWLVRVPLCWVDRRGTIASLCCLSVWLPSCRISTRGTVGFWLCAPCWPGLCLLVTDPLCPQCLLLVRPLRADDYPAVIGAWALADQRYPDDCRALVIFHPLVLCSPCLFACLSAYPDTWCLSALLYLIFFPKRWQGKAVLSLPFEKHIPPD